MSLVDTTVVVRYLTGLPIDQAEAASAMVDESERILLASVVIAEAAHALRHHYQVGREEVVDGLMALVNLENVLTLDLDKATVLAALAMCRPSNRISIPDAVIWATGHRVKAPLYTFDQRFPTDGLEVRILGR